MVTRRKQGVYHNITLNNPATGYDQVILCLVDSGAAKGRTCAQATSDCGPHPNFCLFPLCTVGSFRLVSFSLRSGLMVYRVQQHVITVVSYSATLMKHLLEIPFDRVLTVLLPLYANGCVGEGLVDRVARGARHQLPFHPHVSEAAVHQHNPDLLQLLP